jgi:hypothetical protein
VIASAREGHQIIFQLGAHAIRTGNSPLIVDLMRRGVITHVMMNGAASIHDFEFALIGESAEDVTIGLKDGSFGMAEETGRIINETINKSREGYGKALGREIVRRKCKYAKYSVLAQAFELGVPATVHVAIGTDIIHQHPACDGAGLGRATYHDFKVYTTSVTRLAHGCLLNFGTAVLGPEVFLKALSIARNLGYPVAPIYTANFDKRPGINNYYYRPSKNIVDRPTRQGGEGFNFQVDHRVSIPSLHRLVVEGLGDG